MILNTCAIRENAEDKVYSYLGAWRKIKVAHPGSMIAVGGCVAQDAGEAMLARAPYVDVVFGTHNLHRLPDLILQAQRTQTSVVELYQELPDDLPDTPVVRLNDISAWISTLMAAITTVLIALCPMCAAAKKAAHRSRFMTKQWSLPQAATKK